MAESPNSKQTKINRVMVIGCCGAGKSNIALKLEDYLDLPLIHLDKLFWKSGWTQKSIAKFQLDHEKVINQERWIIDGNYSSTMAERYEKADFVILMTLPRHQCIWGVIKRRFTFRNQTRPDMTEGCPERINWEFLKYLWNFHKTQLPKIENILNKTESNKKVLRIYSRQEADELLTDMRAIVSPAALASE